MFSNLINHIILEFYLDFLIIFFNIRKFVKTSFIIMNNIILQFEKKSK